MPRDIAIDLADARAHTPARRAQIPDNEADADAEVLTVGEFVAEAALVTA